MILFLWSVGFAYAQNTPLTLRPVGGTPYVGLSPRRAEQDSVVRAFTTSAAEVRYPRTKSPLRAIAFTSGALQAFFDTDLPNAEQSEMKSNVATDNAQGRLHHASRSVEACFPIHLEVLV